MRLSMVQAAVVPGRLSWRRRCEGHDLLLDALGLAAHIGSKEGQWLHEHHALHALHLPQLHHHYILFQLVINNFSGHLS
jgi:hypothetical protein